MADLAIVKVYCIMCGGTGIGEANLELRTNRFGRRPSVCQRCWEYMAVSGKELYYDFPRPERYDNGRDIGGNKISS